MPLTAALFKTTKKLFLHPQSHLCHEGAAVITARSPYFRKPAAATALATQLFNSGRDDGLGAS